MKDADELRVTVKPVPGITPEQAREARARAWAFIFNCWYAKGGPSANAARDERKGCKDDPATPTTLR